MSIPQIPAQSRDFATGSSKLVALNKQKLTEGRVQRLKQERPKSRKYVYDSATRGLCVSLSPQGTVSYLHYRKVCGKPVRHTIALCDDMTLEDARTKAEERNAAIGRGEDPDAKNRAARAEETLGKLFLRYGSEYAARFKKATTWKNDQSMWRCHLAKWENRKLGQITRDDVIALHSRIGRNHKTMANRVIELLDGLYKFAEWKGEKNPASGIKAYRETKRERFLSGDELKYFFKALAEEPNGIIRDFLLVSLLVGARRRNLESMRFAEISFPRASWTIPAEFSKNGESMNLVLSPVAIQILQHRRNTTKGEFVFPARNKKAKTGHITEPKSGFRRALKRAAELQQADWLEANPTCTAADYPHGDCFADLRVHDLRRTFGSYQAILGSSLPIIGKSLGHAAGSSATAIYSRLSLDPIRASVNMATDRMLIEGDATLQIGGEELGAENGN